MKVSPQLHEKMHPGMKPDRISLADLTDKKAFAADQPIKSVNNDYPLIDGKGNIRVFPINIAADILKACDQVREAKKAGEYQAKEPTASVANARFGMDGWRELEESEFAEWNETKTPQLEVMDGTAITQKAFEAEVEKRVEDAKSGLLKDKDSEIEALRKQLAEATKGKADQKHNQGGDGK